MPIFDLFGAKLLKLHGSQVRNDLALDQLPVALGRLGGKSVLSVEPSRRYSAMVVALGSGSVPASAADRSRVSSRWASCNLPFTVT